MIHSTQIHSVSPVNKKAKEYLAGWQRERAEFDNYRRRIATEKEENIQIQKMAAIHPLLDIADNFKSVVRHVPEELQDHAWTQGVLHVMRQFEQLLKEQGLDTIEATSVEFNPLLHEAVETLEDKDMKSGQVVEVLQAGYMMGEKVIRPAKVKVVK